MLITPPIRLPFKLPLFPLPLPLPSPPLPLPHHPHVTSKKGVPRGIRPRSFMSGAGGRRTTLRDLSVCVPFFCCVRVVVFVLQRGKESSCFRLGEGGMMIRWRLLVEREREREGEGGRGKKWQLGEKEGFSILPGSVVYFSLFFLSFSLCLSTTPHFSSLLPLLKS